MSDTPETEVKPAKAIKPTTILLDWTADCIKYVGDKLFLNTGINSVPVSVWEKLRWTVADIIVDENARLSESDEKEGRIREIKAEVVENKKNPKEVTVESAATLKDMDIPAAVALVSSTNSLETLKAWKATELRDAVSLAIVEQITKIEEE